MPKNSASLSFRHERLLAPKTELKIGLCGTGDISCHDDGVRGTARRSPSAVAALVLCLGGTSPSLEGITRDTYCQKLRLAS